MSAPHTTTSAAIRRLFRAAGIFLLPALGLADSYTFSTTGLNSMSHGTAYTWGLSPKADSTGTSLGLLEQTIKSGGHIESATLTITGLYDWIAEPADVLYVNILNNVKPGIASTTYKSSVSSYDTVFGKDIFNVVQKPTALVAPVAPAKVTLKAPVAPTKPTLAKPVPPVAPAALGAKPTAAQTKAYNTALANYNTALATYNTKLTAYDAAWQKYANDLATYTTALANYSAALKKYADDKAAYDAALIAYKAALPAYTAALADYNNYVKAQTALGFDGVPLVGANGSIYDQAHSLLRADNPNGPGTWTDLDGPKTKTNLTITFSAANLELLQALLYGAAATTDIGLGFGPECHFYDKGMKLEITAIPDTGATLTMLALGLTTLAGVRRLSRKKLAA